MTFKIKFEKKNKKKNKKKIKKKIIKLSTVIEQYTTALLFTIVPAEEPSIRFNSVADAVTSVPANLRPLSSES
jgi:hypothetical protein